MLDPDATAAATVDLPRWSSVLAVVAHPDDESFGLGAVIDVLVARGSRVSVLCFTHGEASTLHGVPGDLMEIRTRELAEAAGALGVERALLREHRDGALSGVPVRQLAEDVAAVATNAAAQALLAFDDAGVTGHPDHVAATHAALAAATELRLPVLGWTLPADVASQLSDEYAATFTGHPPQQVDLVLPVSRRAQRRAVAAHASQALPTSVLWRRLELLGDTEHLRWLHGSG